MIVSVWLSNNYIEIFGAITGIIYVFLEIRQTIWLWPVGIITSAVYIWVFFTSKFYADMSLQGYYLVISCLGWYWWAKGAGLQPSLKLRLATQGAEHRAEGNNSTFEGGQGDVEIGSETEYTEEMGRMGEEEMGRLGEGEKITLQVTRLKLRTGVVLGFVLVFLYAIMWFVLSRLTDSPVPGWDSFLTSLSIIATWMLARKIYEHWFLWIFVNIVSVFIYFMRGLYPTVVLYAVYAVMSFTGLSVWKRTILKPDNHIN